MSKKLRYEPPTLELGETLKDVVEGSPPVISGRLVA